MPGCPAVAPGGRGSTSPGVLLPGRSGCSGWSAGRKGLQAGGRDGDLRGPGPAFGESQPQASSAARQSPGGREQAQPEGIGNLMLVPNSVHFTEVCLTCEYPYRQKNVDRKNIVVCIAPRCILLIEIATRSRILLVRKA